MNEQEWLECTQPEWMLDFLRETAIERKLRLFAVACCRLICHLLTDARGRKAVEVAEKFVDGLAIPEDLRIASEAAEDASNEDYYEEDAAGCNANGAASFSADSSPFFPLNVIANAVGTLEESGQKTESEARSELAKILRDIFGNPFRPISLDPSWLTPTVKALAQSIYDERNFTDLPVLADCLEEAGCNNEDILNHCRGPGEHVRGCWALDLVLGKK